MVIKERLRVLAELQSSYLEELVARGIDQSICEQLLLEWSRHAFGMTLRSMPEPRDAFDLDQLLGPPIDLDAPEPGAQPASPPLGRASGDPSSVPPGEPWLQLVQDVDLDDDDAAEDHRRAA